MFTYTTLEKARWMMKLMMQCMPRVHHTLIKTSHGQYAVICGKGMWNA